MALSELIHQSEALLRNGLGNPGPLTVVIVFGAGLLTSLGPCSLSLLPVSLAYLAGFGDKGVPLNRSFAFCLGIVSSLVVLGSISGFLGKIYGQTPQLISTLVAFLAIIMGLNLLGLIKIKLPAGPDPNIWGRNVPQPLGPFSAGLAFGLASSPCTTPVLAVLLGWIAQSGNPLTGVVLLAFFGAGQVIPLLIAGTAAATLPNILALRSISQWIPPISGAFLLTIGLLTLFSKWI